jgi:hypothetical protein
MCENLYKTIKTIAIPTAKLILYIAAKKIKAIRIKLPKIVSNKLAKRLGTANITSHKTINNVIRPTTKFKFCLENRFLNEKFII